MTAETLEGLPRAVLVPRARRSWAWLLPLFALVLVAFLGRDAWLARGPRITVHAPEGHGIRGGDALLHRGIPVGRVEAVRLSADLAGIVLEVRLERSAAGLARAGSRFWIVRPELSPEGVRGLETLVGTRHLAVLPGPVGGPSQASFVALAEPPVEEAVEVGGLEVVLQADRRGALGPGSPITYRELRIGTVLSVGLASDATCLEARAYVRPAYAALVRRDSRFFRAGGIEFRAGLVEGLALELDSLASLLSAGVGLATPDEPGAPVSTGERFELFERAEPEWLAWRPALAVGSDLLPRGAPLPRPVRARLRWKEGRILAGSEARQGWVLLVEGGVVGPRDLLEPPAQARAGSPVLELGGEEFALVPSAVGLGDGLARLPVKLPGSAWPASLVRALEAAEDLVIVGDAASAPVPVAASRLGRDGSGWRIDPAVPLDDAWHGAAAVSRRDGSVVGLVLHGDGALRVAPLPDGGDPAR